MEKVTEAVLGREVDIGEIEERKGEEGKWVLIVEIRREADREKLLSKG